MIRFNKLLVFLAPVLFHFILDKAILKTKVNPFDKSLISWIEK